MTRRIIRSTLRAVLYMLSGGLITASYIDNNMKNNYIVLLMAVLGACFVFVTDTDTWKE